MPKLTEDQLQQIAEKLAAANFVTHKRLPTEQMFDITGPYGLRGVPGEADTVGCLACLLDHAASIAGAQADILADLADMVRAETIVANEAAANKTLQ